MHKNIRPLLVLLIALILLPLMSVYHLLGRANFLVRQPPRILTIPHGIAFKELQEKLQQEKYIAHPNSFALLARLMRYDRRIMPGVYQLQPNMSNRQAIRLLRTGTQTPVKIVLHHAATKEALAEELTRNLETNSEELLKLLNDRIFLRQYGLNPENVLTMFIPNTYEVYWTISAQGLFERMHQEHQRFWNQERCQQAQAMNLSPTEISIIASIVQKETNKLDEAPLIAGVYLNRLKKGMGLDSCPTLLHALGDPSIRRLLKKHKSIDSPYNTYKYKGLPPGPICLPSMAMIDSVLKFATHDYFYFSAKEDFSGYHYFSHAYEQHLKNARRYQKALNQARIYK